MLCGHLAVAAFTCAACAAGGNIDKPQICQALPELFPKRPADSILLDKTLQRLSQLRAHRLRDGPYYPSRQDLAWALYFNASADPYKDLERQDYVKNFEWRFVSTARDHGDLLARGIVENLRGAPRFMLEVGSFIGSGAVHTWGPLVHTVGGLLLCIDTWQGDINHRLDPSYLKYMRFERGFPRLHEIFQDSVVLRGQTKWIFPLSVPSIVAARMLAVLEWRIDAVYLDSAHEQGETLVELHLYYELLRSGGVLLGDDYDMFPAVKHDVDLFAACHGLIVQKPAPNSWLLAKPS